MYPSYWNNSNIFLYKANIKVLLCSVSAKTIIKTKLFHVSLLKIPPTKTHRAVVEIYTIKSAQYFLSAVFKAAGNLFTMPRQLAHYWRFCRPATRSN